MLHKNINKDYAFRHHDRLRNRQYPVLKKIHDSFEDQNILSTQVEALGLARPSQCYLMVQDSND